jgi:hypothetical protein
MNTKTTLIVSFALLLAAGTLWADDGFVPLFDGKTLDGWQTTGNWIVEEGGVAARRSTVGRPRVTGLSRKAVSYLSTRDPAKKAGSATTPI